MKVIILSLLVTLTYCQRDARCPTYKDTSAAFHFAHESDCTQFYKCAFDGKATLLKCSNNLAFDPTLEVCTFKTPELCNGPINNNNNNRPQFPTPTSAPWPQPPSEPKPQWPQIQPPWNNQGNNQPGVPIWPKPTPQRPQIQPTQPQKPEGIPDIRCQNNHMNEITTFPHSNDCSLFYICDYGKAYLTRCPLGQHWSAIRNYCDWPETAGCGSHNNNNGWQTPKPTLKPTFKPTFKPTQAPDGPSNMDPRCPAVDNPSKEVFLPHERDCSKFYVCANGFLHLKNCPSGQHWNPRLSWCDWPNEAMCYLH